MRIRAGMFSDNLLYSFTVIRKLKGSAMSNDCSIVVSQIYIQSQCRTNDHMRDNKS